VSVPVEAAVQDGVSPTKVYMKLMQSMAPLRWAAGLKIIARRCGTCHRSLVVRQLSAQKAGIKMHDKWYCSSACFAVAAEAKLSSLMTAALVKGSHASRMPLGLILISRGLLTRTQLREAINEQKEGGGEIGELLVRNGSVSEKHVTSGRAMQWACPVFAVQKQVILPQIQIPSTLMQLCSAIQLHYVAAKKLLMVGFVHGIEYQLLYAIEQMTGCKTQPCFVTPSDFQTQLQRRAQDPCGDAAPKEVMFDGIQTAAESARILCSYGVNLEADEAIIGRCKEYIWTRLNYGSQKVDLLFKAA